MLKKRDVPIKLKGPDPNGKERKCRDLGHAWTWDKELRCYICKTAQLIPACYSKSATLLAQRG